MPTKTQKKLTIPNSAFDPDDYVQNACGETVRVVARYYHYYGIESGCWRYQIFGSSLFHPEPLHVPIRKKGKKTLTIPKPKFHRGATYKNRFVDIIAQYWNPEKSEWVYAIKGRASLVWESQLDE